MKRILLVILLSTVGLSIPNADPIEAAGGRCPQYEALLIQHAPKGGWDIRRMSQYMWRESRCTANVRSRSRDSGLLQINDINLQYLSKKLGMKIMSTTLMNPEVNVRAAAKLCEFARKTWGNCYHPWRLG
jgi:hypothetical protein